MQDHCNYETELFNNPSEAKPRHNIVALTHFW
jgi:hypothetical protein